MSSMVSGGSSLRGSMGANPGLKGTGYKQASIQQFSPEKMQLFQQMFGNVSPDSYLGKLAGGDQSQFEALEAPSYRAFGALQGNIASRFSGGLGQGGSGLRRSSGFQNVMSNEASSLAERLQGQRMGLQRQALQDLLGMSSSLLSQRPYEQFLYPEQKKKSLWQSLLGGGLPIAGALAGGIFGGPGGAALGGQLGSVAGQAFLD